MNFEISDVIMSIDIRGRVHFKIYLLNRKSFGLEYGQVIDKVMGTIFRIILHGLENWVLKPGPL